MKAKLIINTLQLTLSCESLASLKTTNLSTIDLERAKIAFNSQVSFFSLNQLTFCFHHQLKVSTTLNPFLLVNDRKCIFIYLHPLILKLNKEIMFSHLQLNTIHPDPFIFISLIDLIIYKTISLSIHCKIIIYLYTSSLQPSSSLLSSLPLPCSPLHLERTTSLQ